MSQEVEDSLRFGQHSRNGVWLGLDKPQVTIVGSGVAFCVLTCLLASTVPNGMRLVGFGLVILLISLALGLPRPAGQTIPHWVSIISSRLIRGAQNHLVYLRKFEEEGETLETPIEEVIDPEVDIYDPRYMRDDKGRLVLPKPEHLSLGGSEADNLMIYKGPRDIALIFDPRRGTGTVVAQTRSSKALDLESDDNAEQRVDSFSKMLRGISSVQGLEALQFGDQGRKVSGSKILEYYNKKIEQSVFPAGAEINAFADQSYRDLVTTASTAYIHETWLAFTFTRGNPTVQRSIKKNGGGIGGFFDVILNSLDGLENMVSECGAQITTWHTPRTLSEIIRIAFDPAATFELADRRGEFSGVSVKSAGPMAVDDRPWDHLRTDSGFHRVYRVTEWPRERAELGFMQNLILTEGHRQTVTVQMVLKDTEKAHKQIEGEKADWETTNRTHQKMKKMTSRRQQKEIQDIEQRESELVAGHSPYDLGAFVVVSGESLPDLEAHCAAMQAGASRSTCEVRPLYGQQLVGFIAGALPLSRGHIGQ